ncbi:hypothetical protein SRHO_G00216360 [Serrasalmus rhombeus]
MCFTIPVYLSHRSCTTTHRYRTRNSSNLIYPPQSSESQTWVAGGLWNCQSTVHKTDFVSALASFYSLHFLALMETWITPMNSATPTALSSAFHFSHSPRQSGRGGGTGYFIDELDTLLSLFSIFSMKPHSYFWVTSTCHQTSCSHPACYHCYHPSTSPSTRLL